MITRFGVPGLLGVTVGLGLAVMAQEKPAKPSFNPQAVQCYGSASAAPGSPATPSSANPEPAMVQAALSAVKHCSKETACSGAELRALQEPVGAYLHQRRQITSALYRDQRQSGVETAQQLFSTPGDQDLARELAALYATGRFDMSSYGTDRYALALLAFKPASQFRPCEAMQINPHAHWYVY